MLVGLDPSILPDPAKTETWGVFSTRAKVVGFWTQAVKYRAQCRLMGLTPREAKVRTKAAFPPGHEAGGAPVLGLPMPDDLRGGDSQWDASLGAQAPVKKKSAKKAYAASARPPEPSPELATRLNDYRVVKDKVPKGRKAVRNVVIDWVAVHFLDTPVELLENVALIPSRAAVGMHEVYTANENSRKQFWVLYTNTRAKEKELEEARFKDDGLKALDQIDKMLNEFGSSDRNGGEVVCEPVYAYDTHASD